MVYEKNRTNEAGVWLIVLLGMVAGPLLVMNEPSSLGKLVGGTMAVGGISLAAMLLLTSVRKVTTFDDGMELDYYFRKEIIPYSTITDVRLRQQRFSSKGVTRVVDVIDIRLYSGRTIRIGGNLGGFFRHSTRRLYDELRKGAQAYA
jgi:hypothetical protein